jgi:hypothetical protein
LRKKSWLRKGSKRHDDGERHSHGRYCMADRGEVDLSREAGESGCFVLKARQDAIEASDL